MEHVAIDLGGKESQICIRDASGKILREQRLQTVHLPNFLKDLEGKSRVIVETCAESFAVADAAEQVGHEVRIVPGTLVRALGVGARGIKTDKRDAQCLSEASVRMELGSVHVPKKESRDIKTLCGMRENLVEARTKFINNVRGWLRGELILVRGGAVESFPTRVRDALTQESSELLACVERQLVSVEQLNEQIKEADLDLVRVASNNPTCRLLMSVPGVGPTTALRFVASVDDISRFSDAHHVESYFGLTPGENSSSNRQQRTSLTKAGSKKVRWALIQAAWTLMRVRPLDPAVLWAKEIEKRRGKHIAAVALGRKLAGILFAMWRDGTTYQPLRGSTARAEDLPVEPMMTGHAVVAAASAYEDKALNTQEGSENIVATRTPTAPTRPVSSRTAGKSRPTKNATVKSPKKPTTKAKSSGTSPTQRGSKGKKAQFSTHEGVTEGPNTHVPSPKRKSSHVVEHPV